VVQGDIACPPCPGKGAAMSTFVDVGHHSLPALAGRRDANAQPLSIIIGFGPMLNLCALASARRRVAGSAKPDTKSLAKMS
jgi:hypothetical protein